MDLQAGGCHYMYYAQYQCAGYLRPAGSKKCAEEGASCTCTGTVSYGAKNTWTRPKPVTGKVCRRPAFDLVSEPGLLAPVTTAEWMFFR